MKQVNASTQAEVIHANRTRTTCYLTREWNVVRDAQGRKWELAATDKIETCDTSWNRIGHVGVYRRARILSPGSPHYLATLEVIK